MMECDFNAEWSDIYSPMSARIAFPKVSETMEGNPINLVPTIQYGYIRIPQYIALNTSSFPQVKYHLLDQGLVTVPPSSSVSIVIGRIYPCTPSTTLTYWYKLTNELL